MGFPAARVGDMHTCPIVAGSNAHSGGPVGPVGSFNVFIEGKSAARVGDMAICSGPTDQIVVGSQNVFINGQPAARLGDLTAHGGSIIQGASLVNFG